MSEFKAGDSVKIKEDCYDYDPSIVEDETSYVYLADNFGTDLIWLENVPCAVPADWFELCYDDERMFECRTKGHNKFWSIKAVGDKQLRTKWGAIGTVGATNQKSYHSSFVRDSEIRSLIRAKIAKGYVEVTSKP